MSQPSLTFAGEPQRFGGTVASGLGWAVLLGGLLLASLVSGGGYLLFGTLATAKFIGLPLLLLTALVGGTSVATGRRLKRLGDGAKRGAREATLRSLAAHHGGVVTAAQAARALQLPEAQADALLTELAQAGRDVQLEVDDQGQLLYHFDRAALPSPRVRVRPSTPPPARPARDDDDLEELHAIVEPPARHRALARPPAPPFRGSRYARWLRAKLARRSHRRAGSPRNGAGGPKKRAVPFRPLAFG